ncbi:hypothetical protein HZ326_1391 [Fusarium oxysporum f. sp. albedinis]|nr:hypothetical protein HZ326_1391 [Fusarium oxysporum f. sp. albedinis]
MCLLQRKKAERIENVDDFEVVDSELYELPQGKRKRELRLGKCAECIDSSPGIPCLPSPFFASFSTANGAFSVSCPG